MRLVLLLLIVVVQICTSCKIEESNVGYFRDINLYKMEGIDEISIKNLTYPYTKIEKGSENTIKISYVFDDATKYEQKYKRTGDGFWVSIDSVEEDGIHYIYEYVKNDEIFDIEYSGNPEKGDFYLISVSRRSASGKCTYYFERGTIKIKPSANHEDFPLTKAIRNEKYKNIIQNGILKRYEEINGESTGEPRCYRLGNLSYFWWSVIGYRLDMDECI